MYSNAINSFLLLTSLATATGIFLHDTRLDKAAFVAALPVSSLSIEAGAKLVHASPNDFHTHVERANVGRVAPLLHGSLSITPRAQEYKKHLLQRHVTRGHHAFDNYNLPII